MMNSMFLVWSLSSLILSYALGDPILNSTSIGSHVEPFVNVTEGNFTGYNQTNQTRHELQEVKVMERYLPRSLGCFLPTCATLNLANDMQTGDEKAGDKTSDAWGPGKK